MLLPPGCVMVEVGTSSGAVSIANLEASRDQKHFPEFRFLASAEELEDLKCPGQRVVAGQPGKGSADGGNLSTSMTNSCWVCS